ncbi:MAG: bifunctional 4-hydroxy-2-oxoglutarate aldolase/2-dehydro-3-deoxy-phosphogluconate aldolase [Prevotellaceae bacterium]|jgi:2-dehydro-3-deoxyphosphogluconate aldolase/(4S)-4-hydroxy-2-oxoglutarate aldolase|nr:bifunctional 4-hydroxy-2-oxoglutarate aldolase/2-dehydro-3-deoxy-phosphogluconate aldolase [Prevotellaceae bacterium]
MATFKKIQTLAAMFDTGVVPVFYHRDLEVAKQVVAACYDGGIRAFEFTNRGDFAHEIFGNLVRWAAGRCPGLVMGIGSIVDAGTASLFIQAGANFIVGPLFNPDVAKTANRRAIPYTPGCGTVSEVGMAQEAGCDLVKIFPAENAGGPSFIKNILAPMPWSQLMATGGVEPTEESLTAWFNAGVACVGMGSNLFPKDAIERNDWKRITDLCKKSLTAIAKLKTNY